MTKTRRGSCTKERNKPSGVEEEWGLILSSNLHYAYIFGSVSSNFTIFGGFSEKRLFFLGGGGGGGGVWRFSWITFGSHF